jgi:hypothetical protein
MSLYHLIYESRAVQPFADEELKYLLHQSRLYNAQHNVSGLLLYSADKRFLQVLEGEQAEVLALYQRIAQDLRHDTCTILLSGPLTKRRFGEWRMGFRAIPQPADLPALLGHIDTSSPAFIVSMMPNLSTSLLDRLFDYVHHTPPHIMLEELAVK